MYCGSTNSKVIDSRQNDEGTSIRRRRECEECGKRFTTYETIEHTPIMIVKKDGSRQAFDIQKVRRGIMKSIEKRAVPMSTVDKLVNEIQKEIFNTLEQEIPSTVIGDMVMDGLKDIDEVSYVRYASVHRQFKDINSLMSEIEQLIKLKESLTGNKKKD